MVAKNFGYACEKDDVSLYQHMTIETPGQTFFHALVFLQPFHMVELLFISALLTLLLRHFDYTDVYLSLGCF